MRDHNRDGLLRPMHSPQRKLPAGLAGVDPSTIPPTGPRSVNWLRSRSLHRAAGPGGASDARLRPMLTLVGFRADHQTAPDPW